MEEQETLENIVEETLTTIVDECSISLENCESQLDELNCTANEPMDVQFMEGKENNGQILDSFEPPTCGENASTSNDFVSCAPFQTLASGLAFARIADFFAQEDDRVLRCHGFKPVFIPCEKLETIIQMDIKDLKLRQMREQRTTENEEHRRRNKDACSMIGDSGSDKDEVGKKRRKKERKFGHKRRHSPTIRDEANSVQKRNFATGVQCCVCDQSVSKERFGGRDTVFCSEGCISKKADQAKKVVKEGERILVMDHKGAMMNHSELNPTIGNLESFLLENPSYQPVLASEQKEETNRRVLDPVYQKKVESMRVDVRKAIESALQKRSKSANMNFSLKRYKDLGLEIERALFLVHHDVDVRYRKWFKSFITVLNDEQNGFFRDVLRDKVSVKKLVTLSDDQMSIPQIGPNKLASIKDAVSSSNFVVAAADSTSTSDMPSENASSMTTKMPALRGKISSTTSRHFVAKKMPLNNLNAKSAIDDILGDANKDTTHLHHSHLYDSNCGVCKQLNLKKYAEKEQMERLEAKLEQKRKVDEPKSIHLDFQILDPSIQAAIIKDGVAETASNELDFLNQQMRNIQREEAEHSATSPLQNENFFLGGDVMIGGHVDFIDNDRHLRDPLGLETVDALPQDNREDDNMSNKGGAFDVGDDAAFCDNFHDDCYGSETQQQFRSFVPDSNLDFRPSHPNLRSHNGLQTFAHPTVNKVSIDPICTSIDPRNGIPVERRESKDITTDNNENLIVRKPNVHNTNFPWQNDDDDFSPWLKNFYNYKVWNGKFVWINLASFACTLSAVSNRGAFKVGRELPSVLHVMGRSEAIGVWKYIGRLKDSWDKQLILLLVEIPKDDQYEMYMRCFEKVNSSDNKQIIVLDLTGHEQIKDGYVFTLGPGDPLPSTLLPLDGPGLPEWCKRQGCMIIMLVRRMDHEDRLWRKRQDENCRPPTLEPRNIPTERSDLQSTPAERQQQSRLLDPRFDVCSALSPPLLARSQPMTPLTEPLLVPLLSAPPLRPAQPSSSRPLHPPSSCSPRTPLPNHPPQPPPLPCRFQDGKKCGAFDFTEEMEIPADFGLPTNFSSNKQRWKY